MSVRDEISVSFAYKADEKLRYAAAGKALRSYKQKLIQQGVTQQEKRRKQIEKKRVRESKKYKIKRRLHDVVECLWNKILPVVCFMLLEASLVIKETEVEGLEQVGITQNAKTIYDIFSIMGVICLIIISIIGFIRIIKHNGVFYTIWDLFVEAIKALGVWIAILLLLYGITYFALGTSTKEEKNSVDKKENVENVLQEELMNPQTITPQYHMGDYVGCTFMICVEEAYIFVEPTDGSHMYVALRDSQFVATGMEYLDEEGTIWYEFYIDEDKVLKSWVKESDIIFK